MRNTFSLSTSWNSSGHSSGIDIITEIKQLGFDTVELGFALSRDTVEEILSLYKDSSIKVSSLHNMCPLPDEIPPESASPDHYSLSSPDTMIRQAAVSTCMNTIRYARAFGARAVVLHSGRIEIEDKTRRLASLIAMPRAFTTLREEMERERSSKSGIYIDSLIKSLGELIPVALDNNVALALETRYYHREIPLIDEFSHIFSNFKPGTLYYWHDTGHAEVFERLGFGRHIDFLDRFANRLIGIHLHDIIGTMGDHRAPGTGTFDFTTLKPYVSRGTIKVVEAHRPATAEEIRRAVDKLSWMLM